MAYIRTAIKLVLGIVFLLAGLFLVLCGAVSVSAMVSVSVFFFIFGAALIVLAIFLFLRSRTEGPINLKKYGLDPDHPFPVVENPNMILRDGEICHIMDSVQVAKPKNVVTGYSSSSSGATVRLSKNISVRSGGNRGRAIRETIYEKYDGTLFVTNQRIIVNAQKYGFEKPITELSSFELYKDGINFMFGNTSSLVMTKNAAFDLAVIRTVIQLAKEESQK